MITFDCLGQSLYPLRTEFYSSPGQRTTLLHQWCMLDGFHGSQAHNLTAFVLTTVVLVNDQAVFLFTGTVLFRGLDGFLGSLPQLLLILYRFFLSETDQHLHMKYHIRSYMNLAATSLRKGAGSSGPYMPSRLTYL